MEESFQAAKNETALDHYQARKHRLVPAITLAICALVWLAACAAAGKPPPGSRDRADNISNSQMICLTMNEIRRMHATLCRPSHPPGHHLH